MFMQADSKFPLFGIAELVDGTYMHRDLCISITLAGRWPDVSLCLIFLVRVGQEVEFSAGRPLTCLGDQWFERRPLTAYAYQRVESYRVAAVMVGPLGIVH